MALVVAMFFFNDQFNFSRYIPLTASPVLLSNWVVAHTLVNICLATIFLGKFWKAHCNEFSDTLYKRHSC